jgi:hypothetical protein
MTPEGQAMLGIEGPRAGAWRTTHLGSSANNIRYTSTGFAAAVAHWPRWAKEQLTAAAAGEREGFIETDVHMVSVFQVTASTLNTVSIGGLQYVTEAVANKRGRCCHWFVLHKRLTPQRLADAERPLFGRIHTIWGHHCSALTYNQDNPNPTIMLGVEWFMAPTGRQVYDRHLHVPITGKGVRRA